MSSKIAILGAGSWGTALAHVQGEAGHRVWLWDRNKDRIREIRELHENRKYHPGIKLSSNLTPEPDISKAVREADYVVFATPSNTLREILSRIKPSLRSNTLLVCAAKGLDGTTYKTLSSTAEEILGREESKKRYSVLSGPSFAEEVIKNLPTALTIASFDAKCAKRVQADFHTDLFRVYSTDDVVGVEIAGALKNVIAIVTGAVDGFGYGQNARAGLITRGLAETARIGKALGAHPLTFSGLAGMGDLILTCTGDLSRNRRVGLKLAQGKSLRQIMKEVGQVAEGIRTTKIAYQMSKKLKIEAPILEETYLTLYEKKSPEKAIKDLLSRSAGFERD